MATPPSLNVAWCMQMFGDLSKGLSIQKQLNLYLHLFLWATLRHLSCAFHHAGGHIS